MMLYVELVLANRGEIVAVNPLQVLGIKPLEADKDRVSILFSVGEWIIFGDYRLVRDVLSGDPDAIEQYEKKWIKPAKKEGPRRLVPVDPTDGGLLIGEQK